MSESNPTTQPTQPSKKSDVNMDQCPTAGRYVYSVFHSIMFLIAIYLSWRCNKGFNLGSFLVACLCPYIYVIYILSTQGTCGLLANEEMPKVA